MRIYRDEFITQYWYTRKSKIQWSLSLQNGYVGKATIPIWGVVKPVVMEHNEWVTYFNHLAEYTNTTPYHLTFSKPLILY